MNAYQWAETSKQAHDDESRAKEVDETRRKVIAQQERKYETGRLKRLISEAFDEFERGSERFQRKGDELLKDGIAVAVAQVVARDFDTVIQWSVYLAGPCMRNTGTATDRLEFFRDFGMHMGRHL